MAGASDVSIDIPSRPPEGGARITYHGALPQPLVSIILVVFRDRDELAALIDNIAPFRGSEVEVVVVDGGSSDGTLELLRARDEEVDYWVSEPDSGIYDAMNKGIAAASGHYILHLNAGDRLLAIPHEFLRECADQNIDVICCRVLEDGNRLFTPRNSWQLRLYNPWHHQGTFYRRAAHLGYDSQYRTFGDFEHNQRMLNARVSLIKADHIVAEHRTGGVSADTRTRHEIYRAIRTHFGWGYVALAFARLNLAALLKLLRSLPAGRPEDHCDGMIPRPSTTKRNSVSVVIVTHNSEVFISKLMEALEAQTQKPDLVVLVDSGSSDRAYLDRARRSPLPCTVVLEENVGFARACNIGRNLSNFNEFILFLNPDAFLAADFLAGAVEFMKEKRHQNVGILTGTLLGYDISQDLPTGLIDSTGVQQTWFGRFYDRDQGSPLSALHGYKRLANPVKAICGAAMFARQTALRTVSRNGDVFQSDYFMYKEDIDLSLRVGRAGWKLMHHPSLTVYHCRGWKSRKLMPKAARVLSAKNEMRMHYRNRSPFVLYSAIKYCMVNLFDL
jgi:N-acetylglucosaminyl-diphospho-decaprenol L-rhamnosyltransferase